jgi:hypothetical protein
MNETRLFSVKRKLVAEDTAALREFQKTLVEGIDWWKEGVSTFWTPEAAAKFHQTPAVDEIDTAPAAEPRPEIFTLQVTKQANNSYFVMCASPDEAGCSVPVRLLKKGSGAKLIKKTINAIRRDGKFQQIR